ncbi:rho guanine nucleotide exchange factor 11 [Eurytemora carolleeae]|uniref:rho guanine nucleotide exchange factor 11 n=1 Tax=Eurytemora carolleeae TaxID=1294199 RepID=UPI000C77A225|nr:rho guanine nucleotide exchange factor 11 [Eurytemora carolleeae]|eukprot:XP_023349404.1 rho guanine nucleotide exchange factor 11-like [Eurytemora affinis]
MSAAEPTSQKKRTLIVHKDESGYGLTLSGDKPTRVQTVRINGASHRSGVREGDVILKVNGQQVTDSDHIEVVKLIQGGSYVALTVVHTSRIIPEARVGYEGVEMEACRSPTASITGT